jgi:hypothetical protein
VSEKKKFLLRIEPELYTVLEKWAADDLRSVNAQVEYLLKQAAQQSGRWKKKSRQDSDDS